MIRGCGRRSHILVPVCMLFAHLLPALSWKLSTGFVAEEYLCQRRLGGDREEPELSRAQATNHQEKPEARAAPREPTRKRVPDELWQALPWIRGKPHLRKFLMRQGWPPERAENPARSHLRTGRTGPDKRGAWQSGWVKKMPARERSLGARRRRSCGNHGRCAGRRLPGAARFRFVPGRSYICDFRFFMGD
jgi:hypothetical protein